MRYLMREAALLTEGQWEQLDQAVVSRAKKELKGRRFLSVVGPLGAQAQTVPLDMVTGSDRAESDYWAKGEPEPAAVSERHFIQLATVYSDFLISWRDVEDANGAGVSAAVSAAANCARREDEIIFFGDKKLGLDGLFTVKGSNQLPISDWNQGENPVLDVTKALSVLNEKGCYGEKILLLSNDLYAKLHRIQPGTGVMEIDRVKGVLDGKLIYSPRLENNQAALVCCDSAYMDLVIGQDMITAYTGNTGLDHTFRVIETLAPRFKRPAAIVILG